MIIFCHLLNDNSGSPIVLRESIRALAGLGEDLMLFIGSQGRGALETAGVPIRRYWYRRSRFRLLTLFTYVASQVCLYRALSRNSRGASTVIYVNTLLPFGAALWARVHGRPIIYHIHEVSISPRLLQRFLVAMVEKTAGRVIYVSEDNRRRLPIANVPTAVVPNPVTPRIAELGFATPYSPRRTGRFVALMLASPRDFKGVPEFIALARSFVDRTDMQFVLVLNGDSAELARYLPPVSLPGNLELYPRTDAPEEFYAKADVLLNLSRVDQWIETFGLTIVEGMTFGLPVIVPPVGGPTEIIVDGQEGFLVDSRNAAALEHKILLLVNSPEHAMVMSVAARRRARDFTAKRFSYALQEQIGLLLSNASNPKNSNS